MTLPNDLRTASPAAVEFKATAEGRIEGYASTVGGPPDRQGDIVLPGAFARSLAAHKAAGTLPAMLWAHRMEEPIGRWEAMAEDATGLAVKGVLNLATPRGRDAFEHVKAGDAGAFSIGFTVPEGGREYAGEGAFHLKAVDLLEVSVVTVPANPRARITAVKSLSSKGELIDLLRESGLAKSAAQRLAAGGWPALAGEDHTERAQQLMATLDTAIQRMRTQS